MRATLNRFRWLWTILAFGAALLLIASVTFSWGSWAFFGYLNALIGYTTLAVIGWDAHLDLQQVAS